MLNMPHITKRKLSRASSRKSSSAGDGYHGNSSHVSTPSHAESQIAAHFGSQLMNHEMNKCADTSSENAQIKVFCRFRPSNEQVGAGRFYQKKRSKSASASTLNSVVNGLRMNTIDGVQESKGRRSEIGLKLNALEEEENSKALSSSLNQNFMYSQDRRAVRYLNRGYADGETQIYDGYAGLCAGEPMDFVFDEVFRPGASQQDVYAKTAKDMVSEVLKGYNCTVFAYGQTGSGKTHTMLGNVKDPSKAGIIPRVASDLFTELNQKVEEGTILPNFTVTLTAVEVYLEKIRDLLPRDYKSSGKFESLRLRQGKANHISVEGACKYNVETISDFLELVQRASSRRVTGATFMNQESSRSHSVFLVSVVTTSKVPGDSHERTDSSEVLKQFRSKLVLVDLAGSEVNKRTMPKSLVLEEAKMINKSLSTLGNVIKALVEKKTHVPYRESKLTRLLQSSLGGNSKTSFILTCSPSSLDVSETISTLRFGKRAKDVVNLPVTNNINLTVQPQQSVIDELSARENDLISVIESLRSHLQELELENVKLLEAKIEDEVEISRYKIRCIELEKANQDLMKQVKTLQEEKHQPVHKTIERVRKYSPRPSATSEASLLSPKPFGSTAYSEDYRESRHGHESKMKEVCDERNIIPPPELDVSIPQLKLDSAPLSSFPDGTCSSWMRNSPLRETQPSSTTATTYSPYSPQNARLKKSQVIHFTKMMQKYKIAPGSGRNEETRSSYTETKEQGSTCDSSVEYALVDMTKKLLEMKMELGRKNEELTFSNRMLQSRSKKYYRMGFLKAAASAVETKEFMEIIKRKDQNIEELERNTIDLKTQINFLNTRCAALEVQIKTREAKLRTKEGHIRFLEDSLRDCQLPM